MALKRCGECGLPMRLSRNYVWPGNGTIYSRRDPSMRMLIFEAGYYPQVWAELEDMLGMPISEAMIQGQQAASWDYIENNILNRWLKYALRLLPNIMVFNRVIQETSLFGFGNIEILEYRKGKYLVAKLRHPFDVLSLAWGFKGMFEFVQKAESRLAWIEEDGDLILTITLVPGSTPGNVDSESMRAVREAKREFSLVGKLLPAEEGKGQPCARCGLPEALTALEWREDEGIITQRGGDGRFIFSSGHILVGLIKDLEKKSGLDLDALMVEVTKNYHLRNMQGISVRNRNGTYGEAARQLFARGYGNVMRYSCGEGHLEMTIGNPLYIPRLIGRIAGLFEYVEGQEADIRYDTSEPQVLELEIKTA
jgi:hypothetical protein